MSVAGAGNGGRPSQISGATPAMGASQASGAMPAVAPPKLTSKTLAADAGLAGVLSGAQTLGMGARGGSVATVQKALAEAGLAPGAADGIYGRNTEKAVAGFQKAHGLTASGAVDAATLAALDEAIAAKAGGASQVGGATTPGDGPSKDAAAIASSLGLGAFTGADAAMGGRMCYAFERGEVYVQNGKLDRVETPEETIPAEAVRQAMQYGLGAFESGDHAMGGRAGFRFANGEIFTQNGALDWIEKGDSTISAAVVRAAEKLDLGAFLGQDHAMGGVSGFKYERGSVLLRDDVITHAVLETGGVSMTVPASQIK